MKKYIKILLSVLLMFTIIGLCGCSSKNEYVKDLRNSGYNDGKENENTLTSSENGTPLNPFEGLIVDFDGVSPYCSISFNNSQCSEEVQKYVGYSIVKGDLVSEGGNFKIDEDVTVYAVLRNEYEEASQYRLTSTAKNYKVENVPEYITEITEDMDFSQFKSEAEDYLASITAFSEDMYLNNWGIFYGGSTHYKDNKKPQKDKVFFSALKLNAYDKYPENGCFNKINITYSIELMGQGYETYHNRYFSIVAKNIVKYPDGTIGWGKDDPKSLSFEHNIDSHNMESLINSNITSVKADYNVTEITDVLK